MNNQTLVPVFAPVPSRGRILIVEDDRELADAIREWFLLLGATVTVSENGAEAFRHIVREDFDAIISDMVMPRMPGEMFYTAVNKMKPYMTERFVFITGYRDREDVARFLWQYCGPTLDKPLSLTRLTQAVDSLGRPASIVIQGERERVAA